MSHDTMYTVQEVADLLDLHPRTVRNYVRDGRLEAIRIGRQYRITAEALAAMTGRPVSAYRAEPVRRRRFVEASSVVDVHAISRETADRVTNLVMGAANARRPPDPPFKVQTTYDLERGRLKVMVIGDLEDTMSVYRMIQAVLDSEKR